MTPVFIIDIYDQFIWDEEGDEKKPDKLFEKLEGYCNPPKKMKYWGPIDFGTCNTKNHSTELLLFALLCLS
jgi:hypothetical protein